MHHHKRDITDCFSRSLWSLHSHSKTLPIKTWKNSRILEHNWRIYPYCPELPIWPKLKTHVGNWAEKLSVTSTLWAPPSICPYHLRKDLWACTLMYSLQRNCEIVLAIFFLLNKENVKNDVINTVYILHTTMGWSNIDFFHDSVFSRDLWNEEIILVLEIKPCGLGSRIGGCGECLDYWL